MLTGVDKKLILRMQACQWNIFDQIRMRSNSKIILIQLLQICLKQSEFKKSHIQSENLI